MRRSLTFVLTIPLLLTLSACGGGDAGTQAERLLLDTRDRYLDLAGCQGHAEMVADYGRRVCIYGLDFTWEKEGETVLTLTAPELVAGTTARVARGETALEYDGVMLATGPLDPRGMTPVDALPALLRAAREGFLAECALEGEPALLHAVCRDPEGEDGGETELWFRPEDGALVRGQVERDGRTVLDCTFTDFVMLQKTEEG